MRTTRQSKEMTAEAPKRPKEKTAEAPKQPNNGSNISGVKKSTNSSGGSGCGKRQKTKGNCENNFTGEAPGVFPSTATELLDQQFVSPREPLKEVPSSVQLSNTKINAPTKIKLQLFPIDERTRTGLEKDGHNPYLELTLGPRKKISSVVKHINTKWSSSIVALGEPMLFPFNVHLENLAMATGWTLNDVSITTGDVYASMGTPSVFRLRYGWFLNHKSGNLGMPSTIVPLEAYLESAVMHQDRCTTSDPTYDERRKFVVRREYLEKPIEKSDATVADQTPSDVQMDNVYEPKAEDGQTQSVALWNDSFTDLSIGGLFSEASLQGKIKNHKLDDQNPSRVTSSSPWDDLTTLSIGGLLSEASLLGKINYSDKRSNASRSGPLISDSLDAFISKQINSLPQPGKMSHDSHSSILDAEETCHAFRFQKFSIPSKDVGSSSNSFKFPNFSELNKQACTGVDNARQEPKNESLPRSRIFSDENSLGLIGIKWNDSLGPFDIGLSTLR